MEIHSSLDVWSCLPDQTAQVNQPFKTYSSADLKTAAAQQIHLPLVGSSIQMD